MRGEEEGDTSHLSVEVWTRPMGARPMAGPVCAESSLGDPLEAVG